MGCLSSSMGQHLKWFLCRRCCSAWLVPLLISARAGGGQSPGFLNSALLVITRLLWILSILPTHPEGHSRSGKRLLPVSAVTLLLGAVGLCFYCYHSCISHWATKGPQLSLYLNLKKPMLTLVTTKASGEAKSQMLGSTPLQTESLQPPVTTPKQEPHLSLNTQHNLFCSLFSSKGSNDFFTEFC